ncbi:hypothetical protein BP00DRAFT_85992 [Aspergillus indologenus CBS 114.80]|uniref:Uncharacterized protein n=1 Tax=Aspergillus indologenus CBS 114.80 TaxID=1450541 RepID=A0A2V5HT27_9EURO|nr:hypothetical protein BP00DRAFT_85992 [Aspergillus indologenus CBS 114.80]
MNRGSFPNSQGRLSSTPSRSRALFRLQCTRASDYFPARARGHLLLLAPRSSPTPPPIPLKRGSHRPLPNDSSSISFRLFPLPRPHFPPPSNPSLIGPRRGVPKSTFSVPLHETAQMRRRGEVEKLLVDRQARDEL